MELEQYIKEREFTSAIMARELGCTPTHLRGVIKKRFRASYTLAKKIEQFTKGKVKADDIMTWELKLPPSVAKRRLKE